ncbi:hypothetical protein PoB_000819800 [Plakobranchus ocellatus]|uniref:Integrase zinc-binding domain-containing protein n=1 Tax=Plakobranchus ocellatus TaxID=259542 RepID=A0AAV3YGP1_9GAST|nr:hypothetical protein PoB_000819800 [Plakobranchus ocellatus]
MVILEKRKLSGEQLQIFIRETRSPLYGQAWNQKSSLRGIRDGEEREENVAGPHTGVGDRVESNALGSHLGFDQTEEKIASRVWWPSIRKYIRNNIKACDRRQRRAARLKKNQNSFTLSKYNISMIPNWSQHLLHANI